jgi:hypothetical protein
VKLRGLYRALSIKTTVSLSFDLFATIPDAIQGAGFMVTEPRPVLRLLTEHGVATHALAQDADRAREILPAGVNILRGDLGDEASVRASLKTSGAERMFVATRNGPMQASLPFDIPLNQGGPHGGP